MIYTLVANLEAFSLLSSWKSFSIVSNQEIIFLISRLHCQAFLHLPAVYMKKNEAMNNKKVFLYQKLNVLLSFNVNSCQSGTAFTMHSTAHCLLYKLNEFATDQSEYHQLFMELTVWEV